MQSNGPLLRPRRRRLINRQLRPAPLVAKILEKLESNITNSALQDEVNKNFNPVYILGKYNTNPEDLVVEGSVALTMAELLHRNRCIMCILKKIDDVRKELYLSETVAAVRDLYCGKIIACGSSDTYAYTMLKALYDLYNRLLQILEDLQIDV